MDHLENTTKHQKYKHLSLEDRVINVGNFLFRTPFIPLSQKAFCFLLLAPHLIAVKVAHRIVCALSKDFRGLLSA